jgi:hypothetical protein
MTTKKTGDAEVQPFAMSPELMVAMAAACAALRENGSPYTAEVLEREVLVLRRDLALLSQQVAKDLVDRMFGSPPSTEQRDADFAMAIEALESKVKP